MEKIDDARSWATERAAGVWRFMILIEPLLEDLEGAVDAGDFDYAAHAAREFLLRCASVMSMRAGGSVDIDTSHTNFDYFDRVGEDVFERARDLALAVVGQAPPDPTRWLAELRRFLADAEATLGLGTPIPRIRTSEGMFGSLAMARDCLDLCAAMGGPVAVVSAGA